MIIIVPTISPKEKEGRKKERRKERKKKDLEMNDLKTTHIEHSLKSSIHQPSMHPLCFILKDVPTPKMHYLAITCT